MFYFIYLSRLVVNLKNEYNGKNAWIGTLKFYYSFNIIMNFDHYCSLPDQMLKSIFLVGTLTLTIV